MMKTKAIRTFFKRPWFRSFARWTERTMAIVGLLFLIYHLCFELSVITSPSMAPALQGTSRENGDWVLTEKITKRFREARRWEVIHFDNVDGISVMKRVVGLPEESVGITKNQLYIDGETLGRPKAFRELTYYSYGNISNHRTVDCNDGYYVLGDDSRDSQDSRYDGPIPTKEIRGRAWLIVWPPKRMGFVNG